MKTYRYLFHNYEDSDGALLLSVDARNLGEADREFTQTTGITLPDAKITTWEKQ
jgi:hypothetical protein